MKTLVRSLILSVCVLMNAKAAAAFDPADKISDVIKRAEDAMNSSIDHASGEMRFNMSLGIHQMNAMVENLKNAYADAESKTMADLSKAELQAFNDMQSAFENMVAEANTPIQNIVDTMKDFNAVAAQVTVWKPFVAHYGPNYVGPAAYTKEVTVTVSGFKLCPTGDAQSVQLTVGGETVTALECTPGQVSFKVSRSSFPAEDTELKTVPAVLSIQYTAKKMYLISQQKTATFHLLFNVLPNHIGKVIVDSKVLRAKASEPVPFQSPHWQTHTAEGNRGVAGHKCIWPHVGYKFDVDSARTIYVPTPSPNCQFPTGYVEWDGIPSESAICVNVIATTADKHVCSIVEGGIAVNEVPVKTEMEGVDLPPSNQLLGWEPLVVDLPQNLKRSLIRFELFGSPAVVTFGTKNSSPHPLLKVESSDGTVIIQPRHVW